MLSTNPHVIYSLKGTQLKTYRGNQRWNTTQSNISRSKQMLVGLQPTISSDKKSTRNNLHKHYHNKPLLNSQSMLTIQKTYLINLWLPSTCQSAFGP
jgi:hypothetical protein